MSASWGPRWSVGTTHLATTRLEASIAFASKDIEPPTTTRRSSPTTAPFAQVLTKGAAMMATWRWGDRVWGCGGGAGQGRAGTGCDGREGLSCKNVCEGELDMA